MAFINMLRVLNNPVVKIISEQMAKSYGIIDDIPGAIEDGFVAVEYFIADDSGELIYLDDDCVMHRVKTGELIHPETGENYNGEVFAEYHIKKRPNGQPV